MLRASICSFALSLLLVTPLGCADTDSRPSSHSPAGVQTQTQPINGGSVDTETKAVVGLEAETPRGYTILCSGTLISRNLVLTAQHCVAEALEGASCPSSSFGETFSNVRVTTAVDVADDEFLYAEEIHRPAGDKYCGHDIALIQLEESIAASTAKPIPPRINQPVQKHEEYAAVGFGRDSASGWYDTGERRRADGQRITCLGTECDGDMIAEESLGGNGPVCAGDSGGAAIGTDRKVIGVTSRGNWKCDETIMVDVTDWTDFIQTHAASAARDAGYEPPAWTNIGSDSDGDGVADNWDNCPQLENPKQADADNDGKGNRCEMDDDADGVADKDDNCPGTPNPEQTSSDDDLQGDVCDRDDDEDSVLDPNDNCRTVPNTDQVDSNDDGRGDACSDGDGDGVYNADDNCPDVDNPEQLDADGDGIGDACDETPFPPDADDDGITDEEDNCPEVANADQVDSDQDGQGDACDDTPKPREASSGEPASGGCTQSGRESPAGLLWFSILIGTLWCRRHVPGAAWR